MAFDITQIPDKKKSRVVAMLLDGGGNGSERITGPVVIDAWRRGGKLVVSAAYAGGYFELPDQHTEILRGQPGQPDLQIGWSDHSAPDFAQGTGRVGGIALVGTVSRGESDEAAIARLRGETPDLGGRWAAYCEAFLARSEGVRQALENRARDGFGLGPAIRLR